MVRDFALLSQPDLSIVGGFVCWRCAVKAESQQVIQSGSQTAGQIAFIAVSFRHEQHDTQSS